MGKINEIRLNNFRNFKSFTLSFNSNCNVLFGDNGTGKTNLLESISVLSKGRGFRNDKLSNLIYKNEKSFQIKSEFEKDKNIYNINITAEYFENSLKKKTSVNDEVSKDSLNFLDSSLSFLFFLPEMERLFLSSPSNRRNFFDKLIYSENKTYNKLVNKYKKKIIERTKLLQLYQFDENWIFTLENEISDIGMQIYNYRNTKINELNNNLEIINKENSYPFKIEILLVDEFYNKKFDKSEYLRNLSNSRILDKKYGGSKIGPHKSDFIANINNGINASQLSTGQQKTLVLLMLMAQSEHLINDKFIKPILLLDEICSHLDKINRNILLDMTNKFDIQTFLTGTEKSLFSFMSTNAKFYNITDI